MGFDLGRPSSAKSQKRGGPVVSIKSIFGLVTGFCVLGIIIINQFPFIRHFTIKNVYKHLSSLSSYTNVSYLYNNWTDGDPDKSPPGDEFGNAATPHLPVPRPTAIEPLLNYMIKSENKSAGVSITPLVVTQNTTTMTFNRSLVVHCKATQYVMCAPPDIREKDNVFKVSLYKRAFGSPNETFSLDICNYKKCEFVDNIITNDTDIMVIYGIRLSDTLKPPKRLNSNQLFAVSWWEPPQHIYGDFIENNKSIWNNQFNLTMTYRVDSDIFAPYSRLLFIPQSLEKRPNYYEIAKKKTRPVVWMVSHCRTNSRREEYVRQMQKYIDVDIMGACGAPCTKAGYLCSDLLSRYKFYLAFENSLCTDYVTEKFFKLFIPGLHVIPVVRGGADYDKYFPNFTFINAAHFKTPKDLALHLKNLASDLRTYSKYLEYMDLYVMRNSNYGVLCNVCQYLHTNKGYTPKTYNLKTWAVDGQCYKPNDL